ncbi:MAG TPA: AI-2E family transporter [Steroidobacteraceae bacterium]|nr:AI-2E family transporter [Steroidobacteraceae bacterium]
MYSLFYRRAFIIGTIAVLGLGLLRILDPFWGALGWASLLAFMLYPLHARLTRRFKGRAGNSAGVITALTPFFIIAPLAVLGLVFARQVGSIIEYLRGLRIDTYAELVARLERYPLIGPLVRWIRANVAVTSEQVQGWLVDGAQTVVKSLAAASGNVVLGVVGTLIGFFLMLFLLFFLLRDGRALFERLSRLVPLEPERRDRLIHHLASVVRAVVYGTVLTALLQGALVGVGFAIADLPSPVVFGVLGAVAAFIPAGGTALVLVPATIYLAVTGRIGAAIFLGIWAAVVGTVDNLLRPILAARHAPVSTVAVFVGVIGGIAAFGFLGIVLGPVLLSLAVELFKFSEEAVGSGGRLTADGRRAEEQ